MSDTELRVENGTIRYRINQGKAVITGFRGFASSLALPARIEGYPVAGIDRKAFLSCKSLCGISLPHSVEEVGDWAFAHCDSLTEVSFSRREVRFGRAVFKDCGNLKRIVVRDSGDGTHGEEGAGTEGRTTAAAGEKAHSCAELLAAVVTLLDAPYLLDIPGAGGGEWLKQWDIRLLSILRAPDSEGYISQSVYGEEDYIGTDLEEFISARRKTKVRLAFLRLLHSQGLSLSLKEELEQYLRGLTKGRSTEETWQIIRQEHGSHPAYYSLFAELGCITEDNFDGVLEDMGEDSPEMKAFFLQYRGKQCEETGEAKGFFESLEL